MTLARYCKVFYPDEIPRTGICGVVQLIKKAFPGESFRFGSVLKVLQKEEVMVSSWERETTN